MSYHPAKERELLKILAGSTDEFGVFFARWSEIRSSSYSEKYLKSIADAPDLSEENEFLLDLMVERGFVSDVRKLATSEGRHFKITYEGLRQLQRASLSHRILSNARVIWSIIVAVHLVVAVGLYMVVFGFLDRTIVCNWPLASLTEKCASSHTPPE